MNRFPKMSMFFMVLVIFGLLLAGCGGKEANGEQEESENDGQVEVEEFTPVNPSEVAERDYWELARTLNILSAEYIEAVAAGEEETINELAAPEVSSALDIEGSEITHLKQQALVSEDDNYNCIMQISISDWDAYRYLHIFFQEEDGEWEIVDVQADA